MILIFLIAQMTPFGYGFPMESSASPEEMGGNFEGDMVLVRDQKRNLHINPSTGIINQFYRWIKQPNGAVNVPYRIQANSPFST